MIFRFIEQYYNKKRLQTDLDCMSPNQFEAL
ncbi:IS3 family transposase [Acinetobacter terrae]